MASWLHNNSMDTYIYNNHRKRHIKPSCIHILIIPMRPRAISRTEMPSEFDMSRVPSNASIATVTRDIYAWINNSWVGRACDAMPTLGHQSASNMIPYVWSRLMRAVCCTLRGISKTSNWNNTNDAGIVYRITDDKPNTNTQYQTPLAAHDIRGPRYILLRARSVGARRVVCDNSKLNNAFVARAALTGARRGGGGDGTRTNSQCARKR